ncbi:MAG: isoprenylcysteine carboxylmethyltransferase family protein [Armatimonadetes bacterium]|nr:isoprenylcysteine carboxylmethyltransferase family protein [Armatimonadota bacterium]
MQCLSRRHLHNWLWILLLLLLMAISAHPRHFFRAQVAEDGVDIGGMLLIMAGAGIRICARGWKYEVSNHGLVTDGLYGYVRHPLYLGSFTIGLGLCVIIGVPWFLLAYTVCFWAGHVPVILKEESHLARRWPDAYAAYRRQVRAFLPGLRPLKERRPVRPRRLWAAVCREADAVCIWPLVGIILRSWADVPTTAAALRHRAVEMSLLATLALFLFTTWLLMKYRWARREGDDGPKWRLGDRKMSDQPSTSSAHQAPAERSVRPAGTVVSGAGLLSRMGCWLFVRRGWLPWLVMPVLFSRRYESDLGWRGLAVACLFLMLGESIRLWAVGHAGARTRTRACSGRLKNLVTSGPYAYVRNPIYLGNCLVGTGLVLLFDQWVLVLPLVLAAFLCYQPIVAWEEHLLASTFGEEYDEYRRAVPRWVPRAGRRKASSRHRFSWQKALFSERGTLAMLALMFLVHGLEEWIERM